MNAISKKKDIQSDLIKNITCINAIKSTLDILKITYREISLNQKTLLMCNLPTGRTFNICFNNNRSIRIWSFIGTAPLDKYGSKYEWEKADNSYPAGGIEITSDGDLNFYMSEEVDSNEPVMKKKVQNLIIFYLRIIPRVINRSSSL